MSNKVISKKKTEEAAEALVGLIDLLGGDSKGLDEYSEEEIQTDTKRLFPATYESKDSTTQAFMREYTLGESEKTLMKYAVIALLRLGTKDES